MWPTTYPIFLVAKMLMDHPVTLNMKAPIGTHVSNRSGFSKRSHKKAFGPNIQYLTAGM